MAAAPIRFNIDGGEQQRQQRHANSSWMTLP